METKKIAQKRSQVGGKKKYVPLTPKQTKYVRERLKGKTKKRAALDAGYTESMANAATAKIENGEIRRRFRLAIQRHCSPEHIAQRISEGLDAEETKFWAEKGVVMDERNVVAWTERRNYAEMAAKYGGMYVEKQELEVKEITDGSSRVARLSELLARAAQRVAGEADAGRTD